MRRLRRRSSAPNTYSTSATAQTYASNALSTMSTINSMSSTRKIFQSGSVPVVTSYKHFLSMMSMGPRRILRPHRIVVVVVGPRAHPRARSSPPYPYPPGDIWSISTRLVRLPNTPRHPGANSDFHPGSLWLSSVLVSRACVPLCFCNVSESRTRSPRRVRI